MSDETQVPAVTIDPGHGSGEDPRTNDASPISPADRSRVPADAGHGAAGEMDERGLDEFSLGAEPSPTAISAELKAIIEALIFASPEPLTLKALRKLLDAEDPVQLEAAVAAVQGEYNEQPRGLQVIEVAGGYQIVTRPELHDWVRRLFHDRTTQKLSVQALETLAVIAYKQPVTAAEITDIRGVNSAGVLGTLIDRRLIKISGRKQVVGRPFMYSTTREFLDRFGLKDLSELPRIEDMADALGFEPPALQDDTSAPMGLPFDAEVPEPGAVEPRAAARDESPSSLASPADERDGTDR